MTLPLEQAVINVQLNNYSSYIIIAAVGYDYALTFTKEVEYIWSKPWTWMSTLFFLARYFGICSAILLALWENSAIRASVEIDTAVVSVADFYINNQSQAIGRALYRCNLIFIVGTWYFWVFTCSADLIMILRLWALYARSKFILGTLLTLYAFEVITFFAYYVTLNTQFPRDPAISITQVLGHTICMWDKAFPVWGNVQGASQLTLGAWMCLLIIIQYIKELARVYKMTNRFSIGPYQKLIMWEGLVYFVAVVGFGLNCMLLNAGLVLVNPWKVPTTAIQQLLPFTLFPRFVLNLRELYARDLEDLRGSDIDTAFGLGPRARRGASSTIMFADATRDEGE